ncbi:MAG: DUF697 domain-containing protein [Treponema sp.]
MDYEESNKEANRIINEHLGFAMVAGAMPVPIVDLLMVAGIQMDMLRQLAKLYDVDFNGERGKSIALSLIGTTFGTTLGRLGASAVKTMPGIGTALGVGSQVVLSGATTFAVGKVFQSHFENGGNFFNFNVNAMKGKFKEFLSIGKKTAKKRQNHESKDDIVGTIEALKALKDKGTISDEEFEAGKKALLSKLNE